MRDGEGAEMNAEGAKERAEGAEERMDGSTGEGGKQLPVTPGQAHTGDGPAAPADGLPEVDEVPSWRLIATLAVSGALAGLLIVGVFQWAQPQILANRAEVITSAIQEVLAGPAEVQTLYVVDGELSPTPPPGADTVSAEKVYLGRNGDGTPMGFAVAGAKPGFQDVISLIFGYDPVDGEVLGMRVLESKETPGLGDKIFKDSAFVAEFDGVGAPIEGVKDGGDEADEVDMITGATISSTAVIDIINGRVQELDAALRGYMETVGGAQ